ncbi:MAG: Uma2 family endonuclease [Oculatellaceae cyanobacterium Prado106]|jgi:hypothetical protein|nr:Uma2 family endonuclease [Oculatellaceae cyanobacterium Prado106]
MVSLSDFPLSLQLESEERRIITGVSWAQYETLLAEWGDRSPYRVAYLDGVLELVSPSRRHERGKTQIGSFLETYFVETETEYFPMGSTTLRQPNLQAGDEPDESYCIGTDKEVPDLAIEVVITSGGIASIGWICFVDWAFGKCGSGKPINSSFIICAMRRVSTFQKPLAMNGAIAAKFSPISIWSC